MSNIKRILKLSNIFEKISNVEKEKALSLYNVFKRASGGKIVIVDVQPEYKSNINFQISDLLKKSITYSKILVLFNGPDMGFLSEQSLKDYYFEKLDYDEDIYEEFASKATFFDKSYGFFRDLMDHPCFDEDSVTKIVKYMISNDINDIRELEEDDIKNINVSDLLIENLEDYSFYIPPLAEILPEWNGSDIAGGAHNECLAEVEILSSAMNLQLNRLREFIY